MNCLNEDKIQRYIDDELNNAEKLEVNQHLSACSECSHKAERQKQLSTEFKSAFNATSDIDIPIPDLYGSRTKAITKKRSLWINSVAAALLILFVLTPKEQQQTYELSSFQSFDFEMDANQPITEMEMTIHTYDKQGNPTEHYLE